MKIDSGQENRTCLSETEMLEWEEKLPAMAGLAFAAARKRALDSGLSILEVEDGVIYRVSPNGDKEIVKVFKPRIPVTKRRIIINR